MRAKVANKPIVRCQKCGYEWSPRGDIPETAIKMCPSCKHRGWQGRGWRGRDIKTEKPIANPDAIKTEKPREELVMDKTEKPIAEPLTKPEHDCYVCGEPAEYSIEATDLNFTDQGTEYITYNEWFCAEHYQERTKD